MPPGVVQPLIMWCLIPLNTLNLGLLKLNALMSKTLLNICKWTMGPFLLKNNNKKTCILLASAGTTTGLWNAVVWAQAFR